MEPPARPLHHAPGIAECILAPLTLACPRQMSGGTLGISYGPQSYLGATDDCPSWPCSCPGSHAGLTGSPSSGRTA